MLSLVAIAFLGHTIRLVPIPPSKVSPSPGGAFFAVTAPVRSKGAQSPTFNGGTIVQLAHVSADATVETLWRARLPYWPGVVVVSDDGRVAAVGSWSGLGGHEAVTLFDDAGGVLADHPVESFATPKERASLPKLSINFVPTLVKASRYESVRDAFLDKLKPTPRSRGIQRARAETDDNPSVLAVGLTSGRTVYFDPGDGRLLKP